MSPTEAGKIIARLQVAYPFPPLTRERHQFYTAKLLGLEFAAAARAVERMTDDPAIERFPTAAQLRAAIASATPARPAGGAPPEPRLFRVYDAESDDWRELPRPVPRSDPRYAELMRQSKDAQREAFRRHGWPSRGRDGARAPQE